MNVTHRYEGYYRCLIMNFLLCHVRICKYDLCNFVPAKVCNFCCCPNNVVAHSLSMNPRLFFTSEISVEVVRRSHYQLSLFIYYLFINLFVNYLFCSSQPYVCVGRKCLLVIRTEGSQIDK